MNIKCLFSLIFSLFLKKYCVHFGQTTQNGHTENIVLIYLSFILMSQIS